MKKNKSKNAQLQSDADLPPQLGISDLISQANSIITDWQHIAEDILKNYYESLGLIHTEKGNLSDDFAYLAYPSIQKKLKLPGDLTFVDEGARVTVAIQFQNKPRNILRLYLCVIGEEQTPKWLYAELQYQFGRQIAVLQEDLSGDLKEANSRFKEWFSKEMDTMFKGWLDT